MTYRPKAPSAIHNNMSAIRSTGGRTEVALRSALHRLGLRFRKNTAHVIGRPDIVFMTEHIAVFVDGDFWHGRILQEHGPRALGSSLKSPSKPYWNAKLRARVQRDKAVTKELESDGWLVVRYWESDAKTRIPALADEISCLVGIRRALTLHLRRVPLQRR